MTPYQFVFDSPDKSEPDTQTDGASMTEELHDSITVAEKELLVVAPYFVLRDREIEGFREPVGAFLLKQEERWFNYCGLWGRTAIIISLFLTLLGRSRLCRKIRRP